MNCPRCSQEAIPAAPQCPGCGFSLRALDAHFGANSVVLERIIDAAHCLKLREKERVEERLIAFENRFPQLFASVYLGSLPEWTTVAEFGFWLLNRGAIPTSIYSRKNHHTFLLVLDPDSRTASITAGYAAEKIVTPKAIIRSAEKARPAWRAGDFAEGITEFLLHLSKALCKACRRIPGARRAPADQLDTLPPPDLSSHPVRAPGSYRSDIFENTNPTLPAPASSTHPHPAGPHPPPAALYPATQKHPHHHARGVPFVNRPTLTAS